GELTREMVTPEVRAVSAELLRCDRELDRLQQRIRARARPRLRAKAPVAEGKESDLLHASSNHSPNKKASSSRPRQAIGAEKPAIHAHGSSRRSDTNDHSATDGPSSARVLCRRRNRRGEGS